MSNTITTEPNDAAPPLQPFRLFSLVGRAAIVTGAGSGIGAASALLFAQAGAQVLAVDLPGKTGPSHPQIHTLAADLAEPDAAGKVIEAAIAAFGRLDILFNNAGVAVSALAEATTDEQWRWSQSVNLDAPFRLCRAAIGHLRQSPAGRIINTASVMAEGTDYGLSAYCASKAGVVGLTRTLALELGKFAITANAILPGAIRTGMTAPVWEARPDIADVWGKKSALRRLGEPDDVARAALFLASDAGGFITGHSLLVDGGLMLRV
jgi:3-oxoacyl-[acyl-carrier protein] reductase